MLLKQYRTEMQDSTQLICCLAVQGHYNEFSRFGSVPAQTKTIERIRYQIYHFGERSFSEWYMYLKQTGFLIKLGNVSGCRSTD